MTSRLPGLRAMVTELAARAVGLVVPGVRSDLQAMFDHRRVYRPTFPAREVPGVVNDGLDGRRRAVTNFFVTFLVLFAKWYLAMMGQVPMILASFVEPAIFEILQIMLPLPALDCIVVMPSVGQDRNLHSPFAILAHLLVVFAGWYLEMRRKPLRIMPRRGLPGIYHMLHTLIALPTALDTTHLSVTHESAPLDRRFHDVGVTKGEVRVLHDLAKFYGKLQDILGAGCLMSPKDTGKTVSAMVAGKLATLRTCGVPLRKINAILAPAMDMASLLRCGTENNISERRQVYLIGILLQHAITIEEVLEQAAWTRNWPVVPANLKTTDWLVSMKTATSSPKGTTTASGAHCGPRRKASAATDPRATHLRGSGAVVT